MFEPDSGEKLTSIEPVPPGVQKSVRKVTFICAPLSHFISSCFTIFYWYDALLIVFKKVNDDYNFDLWKMEYNYNQLSMLHKVPLMFGLVFLLVFAIVAMICLVVAFNKEIVFLIIPYFVFHGIYCGVTIAEVAVHVYFSSEGVNFLSVFRAVLVLATSIVVFIVLVFKRVMEMGKFTSAKVDKSQADRPIPYDNDDNEMPKKSTLSFILNPGAKASIASSERVDNWVASTAIVA